MSRIHLAEILELPVGERVKLAQAIWESVSELPEPLLLSEAEREKIDRRLEAYRRNPEAASPWPEVKERILRRGRETVRRALLVPVTSPLERSPALWNRSRLDLGSEETLAQLLDRGTLDDWRELYRLARRDDELRARLVRIVSRVPLGYPHFWRAALASLGERVDFDAPVPEDLGPT